MSCSCTNTGCGVVIPQGNQGIQGPIGNSGPPGVQGVAGPTGNTGPAGPTIAKYANNFNFIVGGAAIVVSQAAIISCNPLIGTCVSNPQNFDFSVTVWCNLLGSQWTLCQPIGGAAPGIGVYYTTVYDTAANTITITPTLTALYRVIIQG